MRILLVEDDQTLANHIRRGLGADAVTVVHAPTVSDGLLAAEVDEFSAIVLDLQMPDGSGLEVLRQVRERDHAVPVLVLSGISREDVIVRVLYAGADDYVVKPVSLAMLRARLHALARRATAATSGATRVGGLVVDLGRRQAWLDGRPLTFSTLELTLLGYLAARADVPQARDTLLRDVWGQQSHEGGNVIEVTVMRLRRRLGEGPTTPTIETIRGFGYVLRPPSPAYTAEADAGTADGDRPMTTS
jgi:two-component system, OmpR family, response regulator